MKILLTVILLGIATAASANPFPKGDAATGKKLFDQYQCNSCHDTIMGGDGNAIFTRPDRKVDSPEKMDAQMRMCSGAIRKELSVQEKQDISAYLNREYYHFK
ncbi:MAG: hypothetical protein A2Z95_00380 [Gallionellales bacterium GWA2_60_18]|nr:MAG: hypothetical protein A2Z95_00380 [Gallionellales bacterium GWA2_60_18]